MVFLTLTAMANFEKAADFGMFVKMMEDIEKEDEEDDDE